MNISLVREHAEAIQPPRALWVPFPLGRPLGIPNDPEFQRRVVVAALTLLERPSGPVIEDFPEDIPYISAEMDDGEPMACAVSFTPDQAIATPAEKVVAEIAQLRDWHDLFVKKHERTATGVASIAIEDLPGFIASWIEGKPAPNFQDGMLPIDALRLACDELKTFESEAVLAQPGSHSIESVQDWFWGRTAAGKMLLDLRIAMQNSSSKLERFFANNNVVPRRISHTIEKKSGA